MYLYYVMCYQNDVNYVLVEEGDAMIEFELETQEIVVKDNEIKNGRTRTERYMYI